MDLLNDYDNSILNHPSKENIIEKELNLKPMSVGNLSSIVVFDWSLSWDNKF